MKHRASERSIEVSEWRTGVQVEYEEPEVTNAEFAKTDPIFKRACEMADVEPTKRQASKFRNEQGAAYKAWRNS